MTREEAIEAGKRAAEVDALEVGGDLAAFVELQPVPPAEAGDNGRWWMAGYGAQHVEIVDRLLPVGMSIEEYRQLPEAERWAVTLRNADERAGGAE